MSAFDRIIGRLSRYPGVRFGRLGDRLEIDPPNPGGFPLSFRKEAEGYTVSFGPSPRRFEDEAEALDYLAFGLSRKCRLRAISHGRPHRWIVEQKDGDGWRAMSVTGRYLFPFWRRKTEAIYQNGLFS